MIEDFSLFLENRHTTSIIEKAKEFSEFVELINSKIDNLSDGHSSGLTIFRDGSSREVFDMSIRKESYVLDAIHIAKLQEDHSMTIQKIIDIFESNEFRICVQYRYVEKNKTGSATYNLRLINALYVKIDDKFIFDKIEPNKDFLNKDFNSFIFKLMEIDNDIKSIIKWTNFKYTDINKAQIPRDFENSWNSTLKDASPFNMKTVENKLKGTFFDTNNIKYILKSRKFGL
jgi:hypothetical protein